MDGRHDRPAKGKEARRREQCNSPRSFEADLKGRLPELVLDPETGECSKPASYENLSELAAPPPVESSSRASAAPLRHHENREEQRRAKRTSNQSERSQASQRLTARGTRDTAEENEAWLAQRHHGELSPRHHRRRRSDPGSTRRDHYDVIGAIIPVEAPQHSPRRKHRDRADGPETSRSARGAAKSPLGYTVRRDKLNLSEIAVPAPVPRHDASAARIEKRSEPPPSHEPPAEIGPLPRRKRASQFETQLYTVSYLILFSILGTLARLGIQWLTFYPGAVVVTPVLWANFAGSLFLGFLAEDRCLFRSERVAPSTRPKHETATPEADEAALRAAHARAKKVIPLYIGLATGFCGSLTSFSTFMRDVFLALSNDLPAPPYHRLPTAESGPLDPNTTVPRNGGYSFLALLAIIILTVSLSLSALKLGAHLALLLEPYTPTFPLAPASARRTLDRLFVPLAWAAWLAALLLSVFPPADAWRGQALFAALFAPLGCLGRFYASLALNGIISSFPLGTFACNVFGTAVLGMGWDLQHVHLSSATVNGGLVGGGRVGCQVLQGVEDGFCGALTTVSTWVAELEALGKRRVGRAYVYGAVSVGTGLGLLVVIVGSVRWTVGFSAVACVTSGRTFGVG